MQVYKNAPIKRTSQDGTITSIISALHDKERYAYGDSWGPFSNNMYYCLRFLKGSDDNQLLKTNGYLIELYTFYMHSN